MSGRGVPRIVDIYGKDVFDFRDNAIVVSLPFERLDLGSDTQADTQANTQADTQVVPNDILGEDKQVQIEQKILEYCITPRSTNDITLNLGFKQRKSVSDYIRGLVEKGKLVMTVPEKPTSPNQKYVTIK